jgi:hypothetical protein
VPEFIDPVFAETSRKRSYSITENERFGLVFANTGSINSGTVYKYNSIHDLQYMHGGKYPVQISVVTCAVYSYLYLTYLFTSRPWMTNDGQPFFPCNEQLTLADFPLTQK